MKKSVSIPACSADIDAQWLNRMLPHDVRDGGTVVDVQAEVIGEGVGLLGEVARLTLAYDGAGPAAVTTMISKVPTANDTFREMANAFGLYRKEHGFYAEVADRVAIRVPQAYVNLGDPMAGTYLLLLEDMAPRRCGNQLAGCTMAEAEAVLREMARFHAAWWEHPELTSFAAWLPGAGDPYFEMTRHLFTDALPRMRTNFQHWVSEPVMTLAEQMGREYERAIDEGALRTPHTMVHGDCRLDNIMFRDTPDGPDLALLDWQLPFRANAMWDIAYFIGGNLDTELRREHQPRLLRLYHDELCANGVTGYPFEQAEEDYRRAGLILVSYLVALCGDTDLNELNERGQELVELLVRRYVTTIEDLDSAEFLA